MVIIKKIIFDSSSWLSLSGLWASLEREGDGDGFMVVAAVWPFRIDGGKGRKESIRIMFWEQYTWFIHDFVLVHSVDM